MKKIKLKEFLNTKKDIFSLSLLTNPQTLENLISSKYVNRPGLALSGYFERFPFERIQLLGETEISYLQSMSSEKLYDRLKELLVFEVPCFIVSKGLSVPEQMVYLADEMNVAIFSSKLITDKLFHGLRKYLEDEFAASKTIHGTLVDVFGQGLLLTGSSGIGKSECALDLVERGHRLITDDVVKIILRDGNLHGTSTNEYGHFMEIRGIGLVDIEKMFGIQAIRIQKRIDIQIELMPWQDNMDYERIGLTDNSVDILGVKIPIIYLPVSPGKNVSVIMEVVAMNHILKMFGYDAAKEYTRRLQEELKRKSMVKRALIEDNE
jgi:HPr kinase/phosphorylase